MSKYYFWINHSILFLYFSNLDITIDVYNSCVLELINTVEGINYTVLVAITTQHKPSNEYGLYFLIAELPFPFLW